MRILRAGEKGFDNYLIEIEKRVFQERSRIEEEVSKIIKKVREDGDNAILYYSKRFDRISLSLERGQRGL